MTQQLWVRNQGYKKLIPDGADLVVTTSRGNEYTLSSAEVAALIMCAVIDGDTYGSND